MSLDSPKVYISHAGPNEANILLRQHREMLAKGDYETPLQQAMIVHAINDLTNLVGDLQQGKAIYQARIGLSSSEQNSTSASNVEIGNEEICYKSKKAPIPKEMQSSERVRISKMNFEALKRNEPFGSIKPAMPGAFFISEELLVPRADGLSSSLGYAEDYKAAPFRALQTSIQASSEEINIHYPRLSRQVPMPIKGELLNANGLNLKVAKPCDFDPAVWRLKDEDGSLPEIKYSMQQSQGEEFLIVDAAQFKPSEAESKYWLQSMPLPKSLESRIKESPEDLLSLLVSYLGRFNKETNLTNFRYIAHPNFSEFLESNKEFMPMIVNELKVAHCDLLSWFLAAQIRAHGKPAWVARGEVTTDQGKAFQGACGHSIVLTIDQNNRLIQIDPTKYIELDKAYHPEVMPVSMIAKLDDDFKAARNNSQRVELLRKFNEGLVELRTSQKARSAGVIKDSQALAQVYFSNLSSETSKFNNTDTQLNARVVNWDYLPSVEECDPLYLFDLLFNLHGNKYPFIDRSSRDVSVDTLTGDTLIHLRTQAEKEQAFLAVELAANHKIPILESSFIPDRSQACSIQLGFIEYCLKQKDLDHQLYEDLLGVPSTLLLGHLDDYLSHIPDLAILIETLSRIDLRRIYDRDLLWTYCASYKIDYHKDLEKHQYSKVFKENIPFSDNQYKPLADKIESFDINSKMAFCIDALVFSAQFQKACQDASYRKTFLAKFSKDENFFRTVVKNILRYDWKKVSTVNLGVTFAKPSANYTSALLYIPEKERSLLQRSFLRAIKSLDNQDTNARVSEGTELAEYTKGDSFGRIDWKSSGRTDKIYVKKEPYLQKGINSPLYVIYDHNFDKTYTNETERLKLLELIKTIQAESKHSHREVYIAGSGSSAYIKVKINVSAQVIAESLIEDQSGAITPMVHLNGHTQPAPNLLYLSRDYTNISAMEYIYGGLPRSNLRTIFLKDPEYMVYPRIKPEWLNESSAKHPLIES